MRFDNYIGEATANFLKCIEIMESKAKDYAKDVDPFANFRACEQFGIPLERGILVRISDKISRINNLFDKEADVVDESIDDTIRDAINYLNIISIYLKEKKNGNVNPSSEKGSSEIKGKVKEIHKDFKKSKFGEPSIKYGYDFFSNC